MDSEFPVLTTARLLLRQFTDADLPNVFAGLSHPDVIPFYGVSFDSLEATKEQMQWFADIQKEGTGLWWAVCSADNMTFYGAGGLNSISSQHHKAEIGFWLLPEYWGMGIMKEVLPLIVEHGFTKLDLHRIEGLVETENKKCKSAMAKLSFQYEGTMRECEVKNGKYISLDIYAILNPHN